MARRTPRKDLLDVISDYVAYHKGVPVLVGVGLAVVGLVLTLVPALREGAGVLGWLAQSHLFLYLSVIVGLLGILAGDAL
jgi:hypothetical protein